MDFDSVKGIEAIKYKDKDFFAKDKNTKNLFLHIKQNSKLWIFRYKSPITLKQRKISIGAYPTVELAVARGEALGHQRVIQQGNDPLELKQQDKEAKQLKEAIKLNTFFNVSQKWLKSYECEVSPNYHAKLSKQLINYLYPTYTIDTKKISIKDKPINEITRLEVMNILTALKDKGIHETATRVVMLLQKIFRYAVTYELTPHNIIYDIDTKVVLGKKREVHYPTITEPKEVRTLLNAIDSYNGGYSTKKALQLLPYLFVRSANIRAMEWVEINFKAKEWNIPSHKMKTKEAFTLPLPNQAIEILKEVKELGLSDILVFPSDLYKDRAMSENTLNYALKRLGYKDEFVTHSFRAMFSTIANTMANDPQGHSYTSEVIEACLAHKEPNKIKGAYNRSGYKEAMRGLMEWYANYLDEIKIKD